MKMKSCICFQERDDSERRFSTVAIQSLLWAIYYLIYFRLSRLQFRLLMCAFIKFRAKLKVAQLANFPLMSRQLTSCSDITQWWEDNKSLGCDIRHFMTF